MKKIVLLIFVLFLFVGCTKEEIANDYESLNDKYIEVEIKDNKLEKITLTELNDKLKETGLVYFCLPSSNYCRNNINVLIDIVNDLEIDKAYYIDLTDLRPTFDSEFNTIKEGSKEYNEFINKYSDNLSSLNKYKYIFDGDVMLFSNNKIVGYLSIDNYSLIYDKPLTDEELKKEYTRLYNTINILNDSEICNQDDTGC